MIRTSRPLCTRRSAIAVAAAALFVDQQKVVVGPRCKAFVQRIAGLGCNQIVDEICSKSKPHAVAFDAGDVADCVGQVSFADPARTHENDVGSVANKVECRCAFDDVAIDRLRTGEVIHVQAGYWEDSGTFDGSAGTLL